MSRTSRSRWIGLVLLIALGVLGLGWGAVRSARAAILAQQPGEQPPERVRQPNGEAPTISFIDSPTPQCRLPVTGTDACYINWSYFYVTASPSNYIISMTVAIDGRIQANHQGFFQNYLYIPYDMLSPGFRVSCGKPGTSGINPWVGNSYAFTIRAKETGGLKSANYGTVYCPGDTVPVKDGSLSGPSFGRTGVSYDFTASVTPITTTVPITYAWQVTDKSDINATNNLSDTRSYNWATHGLKTLYVQAYNLAGSAYLTHTIEILVPVSGLVANNDSPTTFGNPTQMSATISAGDDVSFTWDYGDGHGGNGPSVNHTFETPGVYTVTVRAENAVSVQTDTTTVTVEEPVYHLYLPALRKR